MLSYVKFFNVFDFLQSIVNNSCCYIDFRLKFRFEKTMSEKTCMNTIPYVQNFSFFSIRENSEQKPFCSEFFLS